MRFNDILLYNIEDHSEHFVVIVKDEPVSQIDPV